MTTYWPCLKFEEISNALYVLKIILPNSEAYRKLFRAGGVGYIRPKGAIQGTRSLGQIYMEKITFLYRVYGVTDKQGVGATPAASNIHQ